MRRALARLARDARGATIVEFALIVTPLMIVLLGLVDLGFRQYVAVQLQGSLDQASRLVTVGDVPMTDVQTLIEKRVKAVWPLATITVTPTNYDNFSHVGKSEPITTDTAPFGTYNKGDCFLDVNRNGKYDLAVKSGTAGAGGGDDIVYYTATASYPSIMPMTALLGWAATTTVTATIMMRNQPYAAQLPPPTVCS